ncbi:MAG: hydrolase [Planctomycetota bacterium]|jgi:nicotinamidase-related amidase
MARLESERSALVVVDVQERFRDLIHEMPAVIAGCSRLIRFCARLGIPVLVTEQYPAGLGRTVAELAELLPEHTPLEKVTFSCCGDEGFARAVLTLGRDQFLVCGIETHVCVYQTVRDLRAAGHQVAVAADAVSSRRVRDRDAGLALMRDLGAQLMTVEMILFEILVRAGTRDFKRVADILKE